MGCCRSKQGSIGGLDARNAAKLRKLFRKALAKPPPSAQAEHADSTAEEIKEEGANLLRGKGFTVEQLLKFFAAYYKNRQIRSSITTNDVVRDIIIPETMTRPRCYMHSDFMEALGGGHLAERLVSHAWKSEFVNTVLNIILDVTDRPMSDFHTSMDWGDGKETKVFHDGIIEAECLLKVLPKTSLAKTYWLCIFAVDEHHAICGDCWKCNTSDAWNADIVAHLRADPCLICNKAKFNPCLCGSIKFRPGDPKYEIDLFDHVVSKVGALVVSLDADLNSIRRVWVVAEIGKALQISQVLFRLGTQLSQSSIDKIEHGQDLMPSVTECEATSIEDKERIISDIRKMEGGVAAYNEFINCMLELHFGVFLRLMHLDGAAIRAIASVQTLEMDFSWKGDRLKTLSDCCSFFPALKVFALRCYQCAHLTSIDGFGQGLGQCQALTSATFNFWGCYGLTSIDGIGQGLGQCQALTSATFDFRGCYYLTSIDGFGQGLGQCQALTSATFNFGGCIYLTSIDGFGQGLGQCQTLTSATLNFRGCYDLTYIDEISRSLAHCQNVDMQ